MDLLDNQIERMNQSYLQKILQILQANEIEITKIISTNFPEAEFLKGSMMDAASNIGCPQASTKVGNFFSFFNFDPSSLTPFCVDAFRDVIRSTEQKKVRSRHGLDYIVKCHVLLDLCWEKLNTGYWKDVPDAWRYVFTWTSIALVFYLQIDLKEFCEKSLEILSKDDEKTMMNKALDIIKACDKGLLMGHPIDKNPLPKIASSLNCYGRKAILKDPKETIKHLKENPKMIELANPISDVRSLPLDRFLLKFMNCNRYVKLLGAADHWPALQKWNVEYLKEVAGSRTVPVEIGARYTDDAWSQKLMPMEEYLTWYVESTDRDTPTGYLAQHDLLSQIPELAADIITPDYCHLGAGEPRINVWIGPSGTVSPLHTDPDHNILVQVYGTKYVKLFGEDQTPFLYPSPNPLLNNTSQVDLENPDGGRFPLFERAKGHEMILRPGDAVYIPPKCWHFVRSLSVSFSVNFFFASHADG